MYVLHMASIYSSFDSVCASKVQSGGATRIMIYVQVGADARHVYLLVNQEMLHKGAFRYEIHIIGGGEWVAAGRKRFICKLQFANPTASDRGVAGMKVTFVGVWAHIVHVFVWSCINAELMLEIIWNVEHQYCIRRCVLIAFPSIELWPIPFPFDTFPYLIVFVKLNWRNHTPFWG